MLSYFFSNYFIKKVEERKHKNKTFKIQKTFFCFWLFDFMFRKKKSSCLGKKKKRVLFSPHNQKRVVANQQRIGKLPFSM